MTYAGVHIFGPEKLGGKGNIRLKAEEEAQRTGRPYADIVLEVRVLARFHIMPNSMCDLADELCDD